MLAVLSSPTAHAASSLQFSGFGSFAVSHDDGRGIALRRDLGQPVPETRDYSFRSDSILGLKTGYRLSPTLEFGGQVVLRDRADFKAGSIIEGAHLNWHPSERLAVRGGRMGLDVFMLSDYRSVAYAQPWVRPPREFYGWIPLHTIDGMDVAWRYDTHGTRWTTKVQLGRSTGRVSLDENRHFTFRADRLYDLTVHAERGAWQFKLGYASFRIGSQPRYAALNQALGSVAALGVPGASEEAADLREGMWLKGARMQYLSLGTAYDDGQWQVQAEIARVKPDSHLAVSGSAAYASVAYRMGNLVPYMVLAGFHPDRNPRTPRNDWSNLGRDAMIAQSTAVATYNHLRVDQRTVSLGVRWDFRSRSAFKLQWDRSWIEKHGYGLWEVDGLISGDRKRSVDVMTLSLDFVF